MALVKLCPILQESQFDNNGDFLSGGLIQTVLAGTSTDAATYTDSTGIPNHTNPIELNPRGEPPSEIWLANGIAYDLILKDANGNVIRTFPNIIGVNQVNVTISQWQDYGDIATYIGTNQFSVPGDRTSDYTINRRVKAAVSAGDRYGYISASVFGASTLVTLALDSGVLDVGLNSVELGLLTPDNTSYPNTIAESGANSDITSMSALQTLTAATVTLDQANDLVYVQDQSDSNKLKVVLASSLGVQVGDFVFNSGVANRTGCLLVPVAQTNISRTTYAALWAALHKESVATITIASPGVVTWTAHGLVNDNPIAFSTTGALPTGLVANTTYYIVNALTNTFQLSATVGGAAINTSGSQSGVHTAYYAPWGVGDGSTTFGMPWFPADYTISHGTSATLGVNTTGTGKNQSGTAGTFTLSGANGASVYVANGPTEAVSTTPSTGTNLPAAARANIWVKY